MPIRIGNTFGPSSTEQFFVKMLSMQEDFTARKHLYGASAAFCPRQNYLMSHDWPSGTNVSSTSSLYMNIGNGIESAIVEGLTKNGRLYAENVYIPTIEPRVSGKIDIVYADENDEFAIGEIKSCGALPTQPKLGHFWQTATYSAISGVDNVKIIYMSRNVIDDRQNIAIRAFKLDMTRDLLTQVFTKILVSQTSIDENWMPPIPATFRKSTECRFCMFNGSVCWSKPDSVEATARAFPELTAKVYGDTVEALKPKVEQLIASRPQRLQAFLDAMAAKTQSDFLLDIAKTASHGTTTQEAMQ